LTDAQIRLRTYSTKPKADYDAPNPGTRMIGFEVSLSSGQTIRTAVLLAPPGVEAEAPTELKSVLQWSAPQ